MGAPALLLGLLLSACPASAGQISNIRGFVEVQLPAGHWERIETNRALPEGTRVRTRRASGAEVRLEDGSVVSLGPNSEFVVEQERSLASKVRLFFGRVRAQVVPGKREFEVRTQTAVAAVRGTDFGVFADADTTRVEVYEGRVNAAGLDGAGVDLIPGQFTEVPLGGSPGPIQPHTGPPTPLESGVSDPRALARAEVYRDISKESVLAEAQQEIQTAEYQNRKVAIDAFGLRVRMEEYVSRPAADSFKYVVLNTRDERFDFGKILFQFNQALPDDLTLATKTMLTATGSTAPTWQLRSLSSVMSNTTDKVVEEASNGRMVADDAGNPSEWNLFFGDYAFYIGDASSSGPGTQIWAFSDNGDNTPVQSEFTFIGGSLPTTTSSSPEGSTFHTIVRNDYAGGTFVQAEDFVLFDDGKVAEPADFLAGASLGLGSAAERLNFERVYTSSLMGDRKIDLVFSAKLLKDAGLLRLDE